MGLLQKFRHQCLLARPKYSLKVLETLFKVMSAHFFCTVPIYNRNWHMRIQRVRNALKMPMTAVQLGIVLKILVEYRRTYCLLVLALSSLRYLRL